MKKPNKIQYQEKNKTEKHQILMKDACTNIAKHVGIQKNLRRKEKV